MRKVSLMHEFHRLYAIQKPLTNSKNARDGLFPLKRMFPESQMVESARFVLGGSFLQQDRDFCSRFQHGVLDLRLSTANTYHDDILDDEEVNLSLSIGRSSYKRSRNTIKSWNNKIVYTSPKDIIDLEESNEDDQPVFSLGQSVRKSTDHSTPYSSRFLMNNGNFHQGSKACHDLKKSILADLDLNKSLPDDSSSPSNEQFGVFCSRIDKHVEVSISSSPTSKQPESQTCMKDDQTKACTIDLESLPEPPSDLTDEKDMHISKVREQKEKEDFDHTLQTAALSLLCISQQQTLPNNQDSETKPVSNEIGNSDEGKKKTIPQSSSIDSYESLVLKLEESSVDEDSATSNAFEIKELDQKENGIKLRRGSRLKDFQKDILPIISSLSQHEILEDVKILEGVIRSREYKRLNKAKTVNGDNWVKPARSKRPKVNNVGRR